MREFERFEGDNFFRKRTKEKAVVDSFHKDNEQFDPQGSYTGGQNEIPVQDSDDL